MISLWTWCMYVMYCYHLEKTVSLLWHLMIILYQEDSTVHSVKFSMRFCASNLELKVETGPMRQKCISLIFLHLIDLKAVHVKLGFQSNRSSRSMWDKKKVAIIGHTRFHVCKWVHFVYAVYWITPCSDWHCIQSIFWHLMKWISMCTFNLQLHNPIVFNSCLIWQINSPSF